MIVGLLVIGSLGAGVAASYASLRVERGVERLHLLSGVLLVAGCALLGSALHSAGIHY